MKTAKQLIGSMIVRQGFKYIERNPIDNFPRLVDWVAKFDRENKYGDALESIRSILQDENNNWNLMIRNVLKDLHPNVLNKILVNFIMNSSVIGHNITEENMKKYDCNIPWAILMDPTAGCNLKCTGCWAAEYGKSASMSFETLDRIIREGKELGTYFYIYSGGEPLIRKNDLIKLAEKHDECIFLAFTNATLVDEAFASELQRVGNFGLALSIEGFEAETDLRRGEGTYRKVMKSMDILRDYKLLFGFSTCYHSQNTEVVGSDEYVDFLIDKGCKFGWYFTYMPLGRSADISMLARPEQREYMYYRVREFRRTRPAFILDFWNDGEYVDGCIAGGRSYLHINANGDVEPCAFIHYSNANINEVSLLDALKSPLFMEYRRNQPFNKNHLRPCPLLDNPEMLREMVHRSGAHSTQMMDMECVDSLCRKCEDISQEWAKKARSIAGREDDCFKNI